MDRLRSLFRKTEVDEQEYRPLYEEAVALGPEIDDENESPFSWLEYGIFVVLGIAMLWAWYVAYSPPSCAACVLMI